MLDFPATPTTGQIYNGTNGVTYRWDGTIWVATGASAGGDFCAIGASPASVGGTLVTLTPATIISGNTGSWYVPGTGRYSPPAGRYFIAANASGYPTAISHLGLQLRKNGVVIQLMHETSGGNLEHTEPVITLTVDSNGTDWFDLQAYSSTGTITIAHVTFTAYPISGIKGPVGDPGAAGAAGNTDIPQNIQASNYTLVLGDAGKHIYHPVASGAATYTIPANASVPYGIGTTLTFINDSSNGANIVITTDTMVLSPGTTSGSRALATGGVATAIKVTATRWLISGTGLT